MGTLSINGIAGLDGDYEADLSHMTGNELRAIKLRTGLAGDDFAEALQKKDYDALLGLAMVVLARHGKTEVADDLWDAEVGAVILNFPVDEAEADGSPPVVTTPDTSDASGNGSDAGNDSSGVTSNGSSALPEHVLSRTGAPT